MRPAIVLTMLTGLAVVASLPVVGPTMAARAADPAPVALAVPGRANAHPSIATDGDLTVVTWSARAEGGADVYAAVSRDGAATFGPPIRVNAAGGGAVTSAERPPRVAIGGVATARTIGVLWIGAAKAPAGPRIMLSRSTDGGRTFGEAVPISGTDVPGIRGWASLAAGADGTFHASWLDGRDAGAGASGGAHAHHQHAPAAGAAPAAPSAAPARMGSRQDLYVATIGAGGIDTVRLATDVCFCCKTAMLALPAPLAGATLAGDVVVAWRHIYPNSERDIALAVRTARTRLFAPPIRVSADRWQLQACPDDGPALAASGTGRLHVVWPSLADPQAATPEKAIFHARSSDGRTFTPRRRLDVPGSAAAHPQVVAGPGGDALALWDVSAEGGRQVVARAIAEPSTPIVLGPGTYPVAAATARGYAVAWTSGSGDVATIRVARIDPATRTAGRD
jgi:hypothetical protein